MGEQYKWKIPKRKESNKEILRLLEDVVNRHPELRFGQIISNLRVVDWGRKESGGVEMYDPFYEESVDTLKRVKEVYYGEDKV